MQWSYLSEGDRKKQSLDLPFTVSVGGAAMTIQMMVTLMMLWLTIFGAVDLSLKHCVIRDDGRDLGVALVGGFS